MSFKRIFFLFLLPIFYFHISCSGSSAPDGFWVAPDGMDGGPGTIVRPFRSIARATQSTSKDIRNIYVSGGVYSETVSLVLKEGVSIHSGYGALKDDRTREWDISTYTTTIDFSNCPEESGCGIIIEESADENQTIIDGLKIIANGIGVYAKNASPTISNCEITTSGGMVDEYGILINASEGKTAAPIITNVTIKSGDAWVDNGSSIGIGFFATMEGSVVNPTISDSTITAGNGKKISCGIHGNAEVGSEARATINGNTVRAGSSSLFSGGIRFGDAKDTKSFTSAVVEKNTIIAGDILEATTVGTNTSGLTAFGFTEELKAFNNFIYGGNNATWSTGIYLGYGIVANVYCNSIFATSGLDGTWGLALYSDVNANVQNNIICASSATNTAGIFEWPEVTSANVTSLKNNLFCDNLQIIYSDNSSGNLAIYINIDDLNNISAEYSSNLFVDPKFVDKANFDYHIAQNSPAIDAGIENENCTTDFDGNARPNGSAPDIGADEYY